jgi:hypothetical protein
MNDTIDDPFAELVALCAAYRDRYGEWPTQVRLDAHRLRKLCYRLNETSVINLTAHVRLGSRDSVGLSAGGRGVVQAGDIAPSQASVELARVWLEGIDRGYHYAVRVREDYWLDTAQRALEAFPSERALDLEHWLRAAPMGPIRLKSVDADDRRRELLFHVTYLASFGLEGINPKTLAISRHAYGWQRLAADGDVMLMLQRHDGTIALTDPPFDVLNAFPADRDRWRDAIAAVGARYADLATRLAS